MHPVKLSYTRIDDSTYGTRPENPTLEERVNFLEHLLRKAAPHEMLCESKRPEFETKHWWSTPSVVFPHACDCWLSDPFGTTGLRALTDTTSLP
jgi:hypothetical protein